MYKKESLEKKFDNFVGKSFNEYQILEFIREIFKNVKIKDTDELKISYEIGLTSFNEHIFYCYTEFTKDIYFKLGLFLTKDKIIERYCIDYALKGEIL